MTNIKKALIEEFNKVTNQMSTKTTNYVRDMSRNEDLLHYQNGIRFAIDLIENETKNQLVEEKCKHERFD